MIKEVTMYTVICDNCGKYSSDQSDHAAWTTKRDAEDQAWDLNWNIEEVEDNKHYCYDCYDYDDGNNLVIVVKKL